jgi:hypothetical protein
LVVWLQQLNHLRRMMLTGAPAGVRGGGLVFDTTGMLGSRFLLSHLKSP